LIAEIMGVEITIKTDQQRLRPEKSEVDRLLADTSRAQKLLQWNPAYAGRDGFRKGLEKTVEWFLQPDNLALYKALEYNI
jgi:GDP-D-mannose dehydratase